MYGYNSLINNIHNLKVLDLAHRGYALESKESTLKAFENAISQNTDGLEFDIHQTQDGVLVVNHDTYLFNNKAIKSLTFQRIREQTDIPTLKEVLLLAKKHNKTIWIEIKSSYLYPNIIDNLISLLIQNNYLERTVVQSFNLDDLKYIHSQNLEIKLLKLSIFMENDIPDYIDYLGLPIAFGVIFYPLLEDMSLKEYKIILWRESSIFEHPYFIKRLIGLGVTGLMLDRPLKVFQNN